MKELIGVFAQFPRTTYLLVTTLVCVWIEIIMTGLHIESELARGLLVIVVVVVACGLFLSAVVENVNV